jgi:hypothetical protein
MFKIKGKKIAIIAIVVIVVALLYLYISNKKASQPGEGLTIVTAMPVSGYSVDDMVEDGFPDALPDALPEVTLSELTEDVITEAPTTVPEAEVEEFSTYAPKNWRGHVL